MPPIAPIPAARVAWYVTGRFYEDAQSQLQDLVESKPFELLDGERIDLRHLLPHGITQWGVASANPLATFSPYQRIVAFTGSALAAGAAGAAG